MVILINEYAEGDYLIREYSSDGVSVSHKTKQLIVNEPTVIEPSIGEEILFETKYQTMILETGGM